MAKSVKLTDETIISAIYAALGLKAPDDRALARMTIVLEPGKPIRVSEDAVMFFDVPDPAPAAETKAEETKAQE